MDTTMTAECADSIARGLYTHLLQREPGDTELAFWTNRLIEGTPPAEVIRAFANGPEARRKRGIPTAFPNGHYYSPVVDPASVGDYVARYRNLAPGQIGGIQLSIPDMLGFWKDNLPILTGAPFQQHAGGSDRFYYDNKTFPLGDAVVLRAMIGRFRPARIVEVGSGFSTSCMLDSTEHFKLNRTRITCIEPDTARLRSQLRSGDADRLSILEMGVQQAPLSLFEELEAGDILFIDSTHVLKTGSDVHHEFFNILPLLRSGVLVHFHDIMFPFEYPVNWIAQTNYSWNETYALRAFLMYNDTFKVFFWNSLLARTCRDVVGSSFPDFLGSPGSSIWLMRA